MHQHAWLRRGVRANNNSGTLLDRTLLASPRRLAGLGAEALAQDAAVVPALAGGEALRLAHVLAVALPHAGAHELVALRHAVPRPRPPRRPHLCTPRVHPSRAIRKKKQTNNGRGRVRKTRRARRKHACAHLRRRGAAGRRRARARPRGGRPSTPPFRCLLLYYSQTGSRARNGVVTSGKDSNPPILF